MDHTFVDCSRTLVDGKCASCTFPLTPTSETSFSSLDSSLDSKHPGNDRWSDVETPLKKNHSCAAVEIDSGYAGEQPGSKSSKLRWKPPFKASQSDESWSLPLKKDQSSVILGFLTKRGLLPWVVTTLIFSAICFSLLCFDRRRSLFCGTYSNGKYEAIKYGTEELVRRLRKEDRLLVEVLDEEGNALGGKKAALKFIHDQMFGKKANQTDLSHSNADQADPSYPGTTKLNPSKVVSNDLIDDRLDDLLKLSEELKSLESALESMESMKKSPGNEASKELAIISETKNRLGDIGGEERNQSAYQNQMGGLTTSNLIKAEELVGSKGSDKVEDRKKPLVKTDDQERKTSPKAQVRNLDRIKDKGFKTRRKSLAGLKD